jgi:hypothetical protein
VKGLSLLERREVGDDRIRTYRVAFEKRTMRLWLAVAPDGKLAGFRLTPESDR